ncbi:hypothetical protein ABIB94_007940 [Bradyrhizobium sp. JR7.2]|uniref:hypothetical protein n=1 Tax=unclassified Bradyrhizobium TaxID=2631580 RepID=UPI00339108E3
MRPNVEEGADFTETQVASFSDLYAGKPSSPLTATSSRFFDTRDLLANEGISDDLRRAFIVYSSSIFMAIEASGTL